MSSDVDDLWVEVEHESSIGAARRAAVRFAQNLGLDPPTSDNVGIVVTEMATNQVRHATRGHIILQAHRESGEPAVAVLAIDSGPGIADLAHARLDGSSTRGTFGIGLGAITRLSRRSDLLTAAGAGTVVSALFGATEPAGSGRRAGFLTRTMAGQEMCGDRCAIRVDDDVLTVMVADGLGHGPLAAAASHAAVRAFYAGPAGSVDSFLMAADRAVKGTRGAAVTVAQVASPDAVTCGGVGNVRASIYTGEHHRGMVIHPGIAGVNVRRVRSAVYPLEADSVIVIHSDGITDRSTLAGYPLVHQRSPTVVAGAYLRDFGIHHDDASVLIVSPESRL